MGRLAKSVRKLTKAPGVPKARHVTERVVAPFLRADLHQLNLDHRQTAERVTTLEQKVESMMGSQPSVLNAISSTNGTARLLAREIAAGDEAIRAELQTHVGTISWLLQRVETVRLEMMHELRYGAARGSEQASVEPRIINNDALAAPEVRLNLGAGHIVMPGFVNVDVRELPGIDLVATVDNLGLEPGSVTEIFSSHAVEHFPDVQLRRTLLPYWVSLLKPGGTFRSVVPDFDAMANAYAKGTMSFEDLRMVTYGGQEYDGDFHFNGFSPESLCAVLVECGLERPKVLAQGRRNGLCLEFEVSATKPKR